MGVSLSSTLLIAAAVAAFVGVIAAGYWVRRRRRDARLREPHVPYVVMPILATLDVARPVRRTARQASTPPRQAQLALEAPSTAATPPSSGSVSQEQHFIAAAPVPPPPGTPPPRRPVTSPRLAPGGGGARRVAGMGRPNDLHVADPAAEYATLVDGHSLRFYRPADGTLQFFPGRLEVIEGRDAGHEIRFVKTAGPDAETITFGRLEGPPYRHVQLREPTVSRQHARMTLRDGQWHLENLSRTNPVVVNGSALTGQGSSVALTNGDRVEMGEVIFRFLA